jgi:hypothetical protein
VLFDRNWSADASALVRLDKAHLATDIVPPGPRRYTVTVVQNSSTSAIPMARTISAEANQPKEAPLASGYPAHFYSLSHVALPFPPGDPLYGISPDPAENMGVRLGTVAVRGERGVLIVGSDTLMRATCNPFFDHVLERIDATLSR